VTAAAAHQFGHHVGHDPPKRIISGTPAPGMTHGNTMKAGGG